MKSERLGMGLSEAQTKMRQLVESVDILRQAAFTVVSLLDSLLMNPDEEPPLVVATTPKREGLKREGQKRVVRTGLRRTIREIMDARPEHQWTAPEILEALEKGRFPLSSKHPSNVVRNTMNTMVDLNREAGHDDSGRVCVWFTRKSPKSGTNDE